MKIFPAGRDSKERAAYALECLPAPLSRFQNKSRPFLYWTIRVLVEVFTTDRVTPTEVAERIIAAVEEAKKRSPLIYFVSFLPEDVRKQAVESTERYKEDMQQCWEHIQMTSSRVVQIASSPYNGRLVHQSITWSI